MPVKLTPELLASHTSICRACRHWQGRCDLGHHLASTYGCPLKKFSPIGQAPYLALNQALLTQLSWPGVLAHFEESMKNWLAAGAPLVNKPRHLARFAKCRGCPLYKNFKCLICNCLAYIKAKLATENCPENLWLD